MRFFLKKQNQKIWGCKKVKKKSAKSPGSPRHQTIPGFLDALRTDWSWNTDFLVRFYRVKFTIVAVTGLFRLRSWSRDEPVHRTSAPLRSSLSKRRGRASRPDFSYRSMVREHILIGASQRAGTSRIRYSTRTSLLVIRVARPREPNDLRS